MGGVDFHAVNVRIMAMQSVERPRLRCFWIDFWPADFPRNLSINLPACPAAVATDMLRRRRKIKSLAVMRDTRARKPKDAYRRDAQSDLTS